MPTDCDCPYCQSEPPADSPPRVSAWVVLATAAVLVACLAGVCVRVFRFAAGGGE